MELSQLFISETHPVVWKAILESEMTRVMPDESKLLYVHIVFATAESEVSGMDKIWIETFISDHSETTLTSFRSSAYTNTAQIMDAISKIGTEYTKAFKHVKRSRNLCFTIDPDTKRYIYLWATE